jgi:small-conductance mechanosensitive channel
MRPFTAVAGLLWLVLAFGVLAQDQPAAEPPPSGVEAGLEGIETRLGDLWREVVKIWQYQLVKDVENPVTVAKVVLALFLLAVGILASRWLSRLFARRILGRFRLHEGAIAAIQTLSFYFLTLAFFLWSLNLVSIPLTVFTFLGGAVAIGVGFGSQNIVNNFMSGLILIAERPVKVGDLIEIDGTSGRVEHIGARSTRIRSGDNTHVIVPNSKLLENPVLNWTLSDNVIRTTMDVGVAYGSDVAKVRECLEQALRESERVLETPVPEVLFTEFGDNALVFRALFWTVVRAPLDKARAQSEVRFRVDALFREAEIVIAFPQRDVHLDTLHPLEVVLADRTEPAAANKEDGSRVSSA